MPTYTPGEVVERTGFSLDTLRYYERIGLLDGVGRTAGGRRRYNDDDIDRLGILRCLRETGMPIARMLRFAELCRDKRTIADRIALLEEHDRRVEERIATLEAQRDHVGGKIAHYRSVLERQERAGSCVNEGDVRVVEPLDRVVP